MLQSVGWWSVTDVAGQSIGPISIGQAVQGETSLTVIYAV